MNNIKAKHQLNETNYKRFGIFTRLIILTFDLSARINLIVFMTFVGFTAIKSLQLFWIVEATLFIPIFVVYSFSPAAVCTIFIFIIISND